MSWDWYSALTDAFKKRAGRYLINRYLGAFLENGGVLLEQLSVHGDLSLKDVSLNIPEINSLLADLELPVEFVDGFIEGLSVSVPWANLMQDNCFFAIDGLTVTMQVRKRDHPAQISASIFHSMCESFSSFSMAEECLRQDQMQQQEEDVPKEEDSSKVKGVELVASAIDSIIMRVKVTLRNTTFRLEYVPNPLENRGMALELKVGKIMYAGELGSSQAQQSTLGSSTVKKVFFEDATFFTDSFSFDHPLLSSMMGMKEQPQEQQEQHPLQMASLTGRQELAVKFLELGQLGLPRSVLEVELGLGTLAAHVYPHQLHTLLEIISAVTVTNNEDDGRSKSPRKVTLEKLLQQNLALKDEHQMSAAGGWSSGGMEHSSEFQPVLSPGKRTRNDSNEEEKGLQTMPKIVLKLVSMSVVLVEKDESVAKMGGEVSKASAMRKMRDAATHFFQNCTMNQASMETNKLEQLWSLLRQRVKRQSQYLAILGCVLNLVHEEGVMTSLSLRQLAVKEVLVSEEKDGTVVPLLTFEGESEKRTQSTDLKLLYKEDGPRTLLDVRLNKCVADFEPGLVDRLHMLFNYAEMNPEEALMTPPTPSDQNAHASDLELVIKCSDFTLDFHVPKVDLRSPREIPNFVSTFWTRRVHPELLQFLLKDANLSVTVKANSPLEIGLSSTEIELFFREREESDMLSLLKIRKNLAQHAASLRVSASLDERQKLQGKFSVASSNNSSNKGSFFVSDSGKCTEDNGRSGTNLFLQQLCHIESALVHGRRHNNLLIQLQFDEVSLVLPSKHVYEVIYNRLGNDMVLWIPEMLKVKEFLYGVEITDPLQDPNLGFSSCFSGNNFATTAAVTEEKRKKAYVSFPRDSSAALSIHTDTCVVLTANKVQASVLNSSSSLSDDEGHVLVALVEQLELNTVVGLEKEPQIVLFNLLLGEGEVKFGRWGMTSDPSCLHFNSSPSRHVESLLRPTRFSGRAWQQHQQDEEQTVLLRLTTKVLFDSSANLKTVNLAFNFREVSVVLQEITSTPVWVDWLADYFTVVEYPVSGYLPPAILTEMQFNARRCSAEVTPLCAALTLGHAKVGCNLLLLETGGQEVGITISLEDVGFFLAEENFLNLDASVCVADVDYLDLEVQLKEDADKPVLDVKISCNQLRVRTCADTILLLTDLLQKLLVKEAQHASANSSRNSREGSSEPVLASTEEEENLVPDIAAAMEELVANEEKGQKRSSKQQQQQQGAQVFFFPDEGQRNNLLPPDLGMTESFYAPPRRNDSSEYDSLEEEFCILDDEIGTGIMPKSGRPTSRSLLPDAEVLLYHANQYEIPGRTSINFLRAPKGFPRFQSRVTLSKFSVLWHIFGGNDFGKVGAKAPGPIKLRQPQADISKNLSDTTSPARKRVDELKTRGGPGRNTEQEVIVSLSKIQFTHEVYAEGGGHREASRQVLVIPVVEIHDRVATSQIKKLLHLYSSRSRPRQSNCNALSLRCLHLRPPDETECNSDLVESSISVSAQPLRLNLDQDTLFFLVEFVGTLFPKVGADRPAISSGQVVAYNKGLAYEKGEEMAEEAFEDAKSTIGPITPPPLSPPSAPKSKGKSDIFIRSFVFSPDVPIRIDYSAKYVDLSQGAVAGLLAGLASLNCSELTLKSVCYRQGILGIDRLLTILVTEWMTDIRTNQVPRLLGGVGPMYSVLQLFQGIKDLILLPLEQYQKDGRLLRGLQRGANSFTASTAMSFLDITNRLLGVIKFAAELAFDIMSPDLVVQGKLQQHQRRQLHGHQQQGKPADIREGVLNALAVVREGIDETARALAEAASSEHPRGGGIGGVLRQVPSTLMRPVIVAATASANVLEGVQGQVAPEMRKEEEDKWRDS